MAGTPTHNEVRRILVAAADVIFSDGVTDAFLDHWTTDTLLMLSLAISERATPATVLSKNDAVCREKFVTPSGFTARPT